MRRLSVFGQVMALPNKHINLARSSNGVVGSSRRTRRLCARRWADEGEVRRTVKLNARLRRLPRPLLVIVAAMVVVLAAGCAAGKAADPFVGSWSVSGANPPELVVAKVSGGYRVAYLAHGETLWIRRYKRADDRLEAVFRLPGDSSKAAQTTSSVIQSRSSGDRLVIPNGGEEIDLSRVSSNTAFPSPSPASP